MNYLRKAATAGTLAAMLAISPTQAALNPEQELPRYTFTESEVPKEAPVLKRLYHAVSSYLLNCKTENSVKKCEETLLPVKGYISTMKIDTHEFEDGSKHLWFGLSVPIGGGEAFYVFMGAGNGMNLDEIVPFAYLPPDRINQPSPDLFKRLYSRFKKENQNDITYQGEITLDPNLPKVLESIVSELEKRNKLPIIAD